ncbi:MAG: zinc ribbon domain-containing protein, partial [Planctomycetes bacterium]|nr:zinc ribbon domain-containing protein [Planctomycetota bacterium]
SEFAITPVSLGFTNLAKRRTIHGSDNRRMNGNRDITFSGCTLRCAYCGFGIAGERIRRKLADGSEKIHVYYRCGNCHQAPDHPKFRWKEADLEALIIDELDASRMPTPRAAEWFKEAISHALADATRLQAEQRRNLSKRKTELQGMQDRLLNAYLNGTVDEALYQSKAQQTRLDLNGVERSLESIETVDRDRQNLALQVFDFSQNLGDLWRRSNFEARREILNAVTLNRTLSDVSIDLVKRKPFDALAERLSFHNGRGERI